LFAQGNNKFLELKLKHGIIKIEAVNENVVHITFSKKPGYSSSGIGVLKPVHKTAALIKKSRNFNALETSKLVCEVSKKSNKLSIKDTSGRYLYLETAVPGGLRDSVIRRKTTNGILWGNLLDSVSRGSGTCMTFWLEVSDTLDFYVITGKNADEVVAGYRQLTGQVPMLPRWAYGYWLSREKYKASPEISDLTREYRLRKIPADTTERDLWQPVTNATELNRIYDNQRKTAGARRLMILTRSARPGQQRTGAITCGGDSASDFTALKNQVAAGIDFSMSGNPYWSTDIGGFLPDGHNSEYPLGINDLAWRELYLRWFQFGTFCPVFRFHYTGMPCELWNFGEKGSPMYESLLQWDQLRYTLLPYTYSLAWKMHSGGYTLMRGLTMDFPKDKNVYNLRDQFMFGPAFLVKPVTKHQYYKVRPDTLHEQEAIRFTYDSIDFYLPAGSAWFDFFSGRRFEGNQTISTLSPLEIIPVFIRAGSVIPYGPLIKNATEKPAGPVQLRIYPGTDADFVLYEDENDGYNYEKGAYSVIPIHWSDKDTSVTIGKRQGKFPGMPERRTFKVVLISGNIPEGFMTASFTEKDIKYSGEAITIKIK